ncbi:MAG: hypothetical protein AAB759_02820 [Patescibacteria group bacterium]
MDVKCWVADNRVHALVVAGDQFLVVDADTEEAVRELAYGAFKDLLNGVSPADGEPDPFWIDDRAIAPDPGEFFIDEPDGVSGEDVFVVDASDLEPLDATGLVDPDLESFAHLLALEDEEA